MLGACPAALGECQPMLGACQSALGESRPMLGESTPGLGESTLGLGESTPGLGESTPGLGESPSGLGESTPGLGESRSGLGESTPGLGESTPGLGECLSTFGASPPGSGNLRIFSECPVREGIMGTFRNPDWVPGGSVSVPASVPPARTGKCAAKTRAGKMWVECGVEMFPSYAGARSKTRAVVEAEPSTGGEVNRPVIGFFADTFGDYPRRVFIGQGKNCIITSHISWAPRESRRRLMDIAVENLAAFIKGHPVNMVHTGV
jgi:hypothetical protein